MGCAYGVDVVGFHHEEISAEELVGDGPAVVGVVLVSVDAADDDAVAVDFEEAVFDLYLSETDALGYHLFLAD